MSMGTGRHLGWRRMRIAMRLPRRRSLKVRVERRAVGCKGKRLGRCMSGPRGTPVRERRYVTGVNRVCIADGAAGHGKVGWSRGRQWLKTL